MHELLRRMEALLAAPAFDPRKQSWFDAIVAAAEVLAGSGLLLYLIAALSAQGPHRWPLAQVVAFFVVCGGVSLALLWAGASLMFGWKARRKAQALLGAVLGALTVAAFWLQHSR